ncbi:AraC family transcriptional regulator [Agrobacterium sp. V1]|uniref:AraC family transcriptional regulator n=1 Tax=Agrobacterium sp. V1 TaxID=3061957 RepID=UPI002672C8DC|nr:AraC family transcriptional regulator [Agrobacterium sp. V1]MDO3445492.1 AraC family transcriptional regulator ligand-binding domain-containing protein [Agrobacterium sp. V1]
MTVSYLRLLCRAYGTESDQVLAGTNLTEGDLDNPHAEISLFQQVRAIDNLLTLFGPGFVFLKPDIWNTSIHGAVAIAAMSAPTIGDGVAVLPRYGPARTPYQRGVIKPSGTYMLLDWEVTVPLTEAQWLPMMEVNFLAIRSMIRAALGGEALELEFAFAAPAPPYAARAREVLGEKVQYGAPVNRVKFPQSWWPMRSVTADPVLYERAIDELELTLQRRQENSVPLQGRVERLLQTMPDGRPSAEMVAASLGLSRRTMVRRLQEAGTSFRELLDRELRRRATKLKEMRLRRDDIASRLGYEDPASFNRAWRRWFGPAIKKQL